MIYLDVIQFLTGGNVTIQAAFIAGVSCFLSAVISYFISDKKMKAEKEQFKEQFESQKDTFEEQRRQFERTLQNQKTTTYKELITAERIKWLNHLRNCIINTIDIGTEIINCEKTPNLGLCKKFFHSVDEITLRLNPIEFNIQERLLKISEIVIKVQREQNPENIIGLGKELGSLRTEAQYLLKKEWEKIKGEANQLYHE